MTVNDNVNDSQWELTFGKQGCSIYDNCFKIDQEIEQNSFNIGNVIKGMASNCFNPRST